MPEKQIYEKKGKEMEGYLLLFLFSNNADVATVAIIAIMTETAITYGFRIGLALTSCSALESDGDSVDGVAGFVSVELVCIELVVSGIAMSVGSSDIGCP